MTTPSRERAANGVDVSQASVGDLLGEVTRDLSTLMRQEVELAKAEGRQERTKAGQAAGRFAGAGLPGGMGLPVLPLALRGGRGNVRAGGAAARGGRAAR